MLKKKRNESAPVEYPLTFDNVSRSVGIYEREDGVIVIRGFNNNLKCGWEFGLVVIGVNGIGTSFESSTAAQGNYRRIRTITLEDDMAG